MGTRIDEEGKSMTYTQMLLSGSVYVPKKDKDGKDLYKLEIDITPEESVTMQAWSDNNCDVSANSMEDLGYFTPGTNECSMGVWNTSGEGAPQVRLRLHVRHLDGHARCRRHHRPLAAGRQG